MRMMLHALDCSKGTYLLYKSVMDAIVLVKKDFKLTKRRMHLTKRRMRHSLWAPGTGVNLKVFSSEECKIGFLEGSSCPNLACIEKFGSACWLY